MSKFLAGVVASLFMAGAAKAQQEIVIAHVIGPQSHYGLGAQAFIDTLHELSGGTFTGSQAAAGALGGERDLIEGLKLGSIDMAITSSSALGLFVPELLVLDLPFLFRDYAHARSVLDGDIGEALMAHVNAGGVVGLAWSEGGFRHFTSSVRPIVTPEDLNGQVMRTLENRIHIAAFEAMGASPTPMAWPEVYGALQTGVLDAQENSLPVMVDARFWEVQQYFTRSAHVYFPALVMVSPALYESLTEEQRGWFMEAARASVAATRAEVDRIERDGVEEMRRNGMTIVETFDPEPFRRLAVEASWGLHTERFGTDIVDRIVAAE